MTYQKRAYRGILLLFAAITAPSLAIAEVVMSTVQFGPTVAGTTANTESKELVRAATEAFQSGNAEALKTAYEAATKSVKGMPPIELFVAKLRIESGRLGEAIAGLDEFLIGDPTNPEAYVALGEIALRSQRLTEANLLLARAQKLCEEGKLPEARKPSIESGLIALRAEVAERRRQWDEADALYKQLIPLKDDASEVQWRLGRMLVLKGDIEKGVEAMSEARGSNEKLPSGELTAALILSEKRNLVDSEKWFQSAIKADRENLANWSEYLKWLLVNGRPADARRAIDKLTPEMRKTRPLAMLDGLTARCLDDAASAETIFSQLHQANPADLEAADQLALVLVDGTDEAKRGRALQLSEANLRQAPNVENAVATAAWVQFKLGSVDVADRLLGELASKIAMSPQTAYYVAQVLKAKGKTAESKAVLAATLKSPGIFIQRAKVTAELAAEK